MEKIPKETLAKCLTVGDVSKELLQHDASNRVFFCTDTKPRILPVNYVDAYCDDELVIEQGSVWLKSVDHSEFQAGADTIVVLGNES